MKTQLEEPWKTSDFVKKDDRPSTAVMKPDDPATAIPVLEGPGPLFMSNESGELRSRWEKIQIEFVDEPHKSVERADELVAAVIKRLSEIFSDERKKLEHAWEGTDSVSTEDLRLALRRYRSFFDRLLSM